MIFQLVVVQTVYDRMEVFDGVAEIVNNHPLLQPLESPITDDYAREFYEKMLDHYNARAEGPGKKKGFSRQIELLAHIVFAAYVEEILGMIAKDKEDFQKVYKETQELVNFDKS